MIDFDQRPIIVVVENGRWATFSLSGIPTLRDRYLVSLINMQGGIDAKVPNGKYYFNTTMFMGAVQVTLLPA
jgi:hypothetical protein